MDNDEAPPPPKPRKPTIFRQRTSSSEEEKSEEVSLPKPDKPRALQGKDHLPNQTEKYLWWWSAEGRRTERNEIPAMAGPAAGPLSIPLAREEETVTEIPEKYISFVIQLKLSTGELITRGHRFSEFVAFHKEWKREYPGVDVELPKKLLSVKDEDIARRCVELQLYLRNLCEITALRYYVARFIGCSEDVLRDALQIKQAARVSLPPIVDPGEIVSRKHHATHNHLPKIALDGSSIPSGPVKPLPPPPGENDQPVAQGLSQKMLGFFFQREEPKATIVEPPRVAEVVGTSTIVSSEPMSSPVAPTHSNEVSTTPPSAHSRLGTAEKNVSAPTTKSPTVVTASHLRPVSSKPTTTSNKPLFPPLTPAPTKCTSPVSSAQNRKQVIMSPTSKQDRKIPASESTVKKGTDLPLKKAADSQTKSTLNPMGLSVKERMAKFEKH